MAHPDPLRRQASTRLTTMGALGLASVLLLGLGLAILLLLPRGSARRPMDFEQGRLVRRIAALRVYAEREKLGSLLPQGDAVLSIREPLLQSAVARSLPFRQDFEDGRYIARLDSAVVRLEDGVAEVTLVGRGFPAGEENSDFYVDLELSGLIDVVEVDPESGTLTAGLAITGMRVRRAGPQGLRRVTHPAARFFGRLRAEDWNRQRRTIRLPIRLEREIVLPALSGDVSIPESRISVAVSVSAVTTLERRMVVSLALASDSVSGEKSGPPVAAWNEAKVRGATRVGGSRSSRMAEGRQLAARVRALARSDRLWQGVAASDRDVTALVPVSVLQMVVTRVSRRYLRGVDVDIRPAVTARLDQRVRVRILGNRWGVGRVRGTVDISHLRGRLTVVGAPELRLDPPRELEIRAPVAVLSGRGTVRMNMEWDPAFLVSIVCKGFRFQQTLAGEVLPFRHPVTTHVRFTVLDSSIVGRPRMERDRLEISADLTDGSWAKVRSTLAQQDRFSRCGMAMDPDSVLDKLHGFAARGVKVRLPAKIFKPFHLPVTLENRYTAGDFRIEAQAYDPAIDVEPDFLRFSFRARLRVVGSRAAAQAQAQRSSATPSSKPPLSSSPAVPVTP